MPSSYLPQWSVRQRLLPLLLMKDRASAEDIRMEDLAFQCSETESLLAKIQIKDTLLTILKTSAAIIPSPVDRAIQRDTVHLSVMGNP